MLKKFFQWIRRLCGLNAEEESIVFPDATTLRQETLDNAPFITDKEILEEIREAQEDYRNWTDVSGCQISDESVAKLEEKNIKVARNYDTVGFSLEW